MAEDQPRYVSSLRLSPWQDTMAPAAYEQLRDPAVQRYLDVSWQAISDTSKWIEQVQVLEILGVAVYRAIMVGPALVGGISLIILDQTAGLAEMGTWLGKDHQGKGFNDQAKRLMLDYGFRHLGLTTVLLFTLTDNQQSLAALERLPYVRWDEAGEYAEWRRYKEFIFSRPVRVAMVRREDIETV